MKTIFQVCLITSLLICGNLAFSQEKIALIVAIGDYPAESGWMKISSENDVPLIKSALIKQGFKEESIAIIQDAEATHDGIIKAVKSHLAGKATRGGVAFFHYSGHGQQVADNNGDENDGYDEALVPYDSPMRYIEGVYEGKNLIRDEELGDALDEVRAKLGPSGNLLAVIDACHSGTGTRGMAPARGTDLPMAPPNYKATNSRGSAASDPNGMEGKKEENLAPMAAFFGASPNQLNFETKDESGKGVGSLSYAFSKKFAEADKSTTYRGLFDQIKLEMSSSAPRQQPQAEGLLDQQIMGGNIVGKTSYFQVKNVNDASTVVIGGGWLQGINEGTVIGFYPPETREHSGKEPITKGTVAKSSALESIVYLDKELEEVEALGSWAMVLEQSFGSLQINIKLDVENKSIHDAFNEKMSAYPILKQDGQPDLIVIEKDEKIQLLTKDDYLLEEIPNNMSPNGIATRFITKMIGYGQAKFLRNLQVSSYYIPLEFEFVPVKYDSRTGSPVENIPLEEKMDEAGNLHFQDGDGFQIKIYNQGEKTAYYTLIDIQPDNLVNILIPDSKAKEVPVDFQIGPGEIILVKKVFAIGPPAGTEVFKLVATDEPIDLGSIVQSRGATKDASPNPFERLYAETQFNDNVTMTRGTKPISVSSSKVNVFSKVFIID